MFLQFEYFSSLNLSIASFCWVSLGRNHSINTNWRGPTCIVPSNSVGHENYEIEPFDYEILLKRAKIRTSRRYIFMGLSVKFRSHSWNFRFSWFRIKTQTVIVWSQEETLPVWSQKKKLVLDDTNSKLFFLKKKN